MITFDPHPRIALGNRVDLLTTLERRLELIEEAGIATAARRAASLPSFSSSPRRSSPSATSARSEPRSSLAGEDFRFGVRRSGDLALLERLGFQVVVPPEVEGVSSTAIRAAIAEGDVVSAARMLGSPFELDGTVVAGHQRGGTLGYPDGEPPPGAGPRLPTLRDLRRLSA